MEKKKIQVFTSEDKLMQVADELRYYINHVDIISYYNNINIYRIDDKNSIYVYDDLMKKMNLELPDSKFVKFRIKLNTNTNLESDTLYIGVNEKFDIEKMKKEIRESVLALPCLC